MYTTDTIQRRALAERMANMGLGAGGGASQRATTNQSNAFLSGLKSVDLAQQGYIDEQNRGIDQANAQNQATIADITAQNAAGRNAERNMLKAVSSLTNLPVDVQDKANVAARQTFYDHLKAGEGGKAAAYNYRGFIRPFISNT